MCGRFSLTRPMVDISLGLESEPLSELTPFEPSWNVAPQQWVPVITSTGVHGESNVPRHMRLMRWGFRPSWGKPSNREPINARFETVTEKPMFKQAYARRRGIVPADGWYEWMTTPQGKTPWYHYRMDGSPCYLAVVWETWRDDEHHLESFVMLTTQANEDRKDVHHRMPVILQPNEIKDWLCGEGTPSATEVGLIDRHPVSQKVNNATHDGPELIRAIPTLLDHE